MRAHVIQWGDQCTFLALDSGLVVALRGVRDIDARPDAVEPMIRFWEEQQTAIPLSEEEAAAIRDRFNGIVD